MEREAAPRPGQVFEEYRRRSCHRRSQRDQSQGLERVEAGRMFRMPYERELRLEPNHSPNPSDNAHKTTQCVRRSSLI